jgi:membrane protease YdiL (CAAX protease family)
VRAIRVRVRRVARRHPTTSALGTVLLGAALVVGTGIVIPSFLPGGSTYGLVAGLLLAVAEVALAVVLVGGSADRLGLARPRALWATAAFFVAAPFVGFVLRGFAIWALSNVEATGEAPIEAFVAWPSGLLSFGALAVVAPVAEEVFFRGFVFGAVDDGRWGGRRALAFLLAWSLFALAHVQQVWGNWGGLLAVTTAGFVFTTLRAVSGSTLVPALAHLVYNALLSVSVLTAALVGFAP